MFAVCYDPIFRIKYYNEFNTICLASYLIVPLEEWNSAQYL